MVKKVSKRMAAKVKKVAKVHMPKERRVRTFEQKLTRPSGEAIDVGNMIHEAVEKALKRQHAEVHVNLEMRKAEEEPKKNMAEKAIDIIYGDREQTYGHPGLNLKSIAQFWTTYLHRKASVEQARFEQHFGPIADNIGDISKLMPVITEDDVCQMMVLLKTARLLNYPGHMDSQVDQIGYILLQERIRE